MTGYHAVSILRATGAKVNADANGHLLINGHVAPLLLEVIKKRKAEALEAVRDNLCVEFCFNAEDIPADHRHIIFHKFSGVIEVVREQRQRLFCNS